jgi:monoamine oxidase
MKQLEADAGPGGLGPWFAAEHRNTAHHHVQVVLAARREIAPGRFSTLIINRARLQQMKEAIWADIEHQRASERERAEAMPARAIPSPTQKPDLNRHDLPRWRWMGVPAAKSRSRSRVRRLLRGHHPIANNLFRLQAVARRYHQQMEHELERELVQADREGWAR